MEHADLAARVRQREDAYGRRYQTGRWRVLSWLALGHACLTAICLTPPVLVLVLLIHYGARLWTLWLAVFGIHYLWSTLREFRADDTEHQEAQTPVRREDAPKLFALIEEVRQCVGGPLLTRLHLSERFNASITQRPSWIPGRARHSMEIGLPMLLCLSREQLAIVIAHEYGHLAGAHGNLAFRLSELRRVLSRVQQHAQANQSRSGAGTVLAYMHRCTSIGLEIFLNWYVPRFDAETFALRRAAEYSADLASARLLGQEKAVEALYAVATIRRWLDDQFWPSVYAPARAERAPSGAPFSSLLTASENPFCDLTEANLWLYEELRQTTGFEDTHPSLRDRVTALGAEMSTAVAPDFHGDRARQLILDVILQSHAKHMDAAWIEEAAPCWQTHRDWWRELESEYHGLLRRKATQNLHAHDWLRLAHLTQTLGFPGESDALANAAHLDDHDPDVVYAQAMSALNRGQYGAAGVHLRSAMQLSQDHRLRCVLGLTKLALIQGEASAAKRWRAAADAEEMQRCELFKELHELTIGDDLVPHELPHYELRLLRETISQLFRLSQV